MRADPSRRDLLKAGAVTGGLLLTVGLPASEAAEAAPDVPPSAFIRIDKDGITLIIPRVEMGEGTYTSLPMLIAEELEVGLDQIRLEPAPPDARLYSDPINGEQVTGTSATTMGFYDPLRRAGAAARTMLVAAAAKRWGVAAAECHAERAAVLHAASGRSLAYGELAADAAKLHPPKQVALKEPKDFTLVGKPVKRLDMPDKVTGKAQFAIDMRLPGMKVATVAACPVFGGRLARLDDARARQVKGVRQIVRLPDAVAVVADHMGAARKGLEALDIVWDEGPGAGDSSAAIRAAMNKASQRQGAVGTKTGDAAKALASAAKRLEAVYEIPLLAHATMEPMSCTVQVAKDGCDVWVGTQAPVRAQEAAAKAAGLPVSKVRIHNQLIGGGFGRRLYGDFIAQAVAIGRQVEGPVKVIWTREEDMRHDRYRPCYLDRLAAGLDAEGNPVAWTHRVCASAVSAGWDPSSVKNGLDDDAVDAAAGPYGFPNVLIDYVRHEPGRVPTGWWRGVGPTHNTFMVESFVDELAAAAGKDPVAFRRPLLAKAPRVQKVLDLAAEKSGWSTKLPPGRGRGVSVLSSFGSNLAQVAEVTVAADGSVRVDRVVCAVDCGRIVNPDTVRAQVEGGIIFGITAALYGEITIDRGRVEQGNFDSYRLLRIDEAPAIEVHIVESAEAPGGIGEPPTATVMPAVANAIFAATGK
ncbi:MAG TPA: xanthine dehydrogenase family protein molybdopterin-binding subunit, partial [Stellaceae bacterium]|nr:xanthine dehydrogenase family protein molybdopterin-binding subunit [Stellaceae bacterium]